MRDFTCPNCGQHLAFENSVCLLCGSALGFSPDDIALLVIASGEGEGSKRGGAVDSSQYHRCANRHVAECNWLVKVNPAMGAVAELCASCKLTRSRPSDGDTAALAAFAAAEQAKRRLVVELIDLKMPIVSRDQHPEYGLTFDLLSSEFEKVVTGHHNGVITWTSPKATTCTASSCGSRWPSRIAPCCGTSATRSGIATSTGCSGRRPATPSGFASCSATPTATIWGRCTGTTAWLRRRAGEELRLLVRGNAPRRELGGNLRALPTYPRPLDTATFERRALGPSGFDTIIETWLPLAWALNMVNRSMGRDDLYPFVLPAAVLEKMRFIHTIRRGRLRSGQAGHGRRRGMTCAQSPVYDVGRDRRPTLLT